MGYTVLDENFVIEPELEQLEEKKHMVFEKGSKKNEE